MKLETKTWKKIAFVAIVVNILLITSFAYVLASPNGKFYISKGVYPASPMYTIWKEASNFLAKDAWGFIPSWGESTNASYVVNNAITNVADNGTVFLKSALYTLTAPFNMRSHMILAGEGSETLLRVEAGYQINAIQYMSSTWGVESTIRDLYIDGQRALQSESGNEQLQNGIAVQNFESMWIKDVIVDNAYHNGIYLFYDLGQPSADCQIYNVVLRYCGHDGLRIENSNGHTAYGGYYAQCGYNGIKVSLSTNVGIIGATVGLNGQNGVLFVNNEDCRVEGGSRSNENDLDGIRLEDQGGATNVNCIVSDNHIKNNKQHGISLIGAQYTNVQGNQIKNNGKLASNTYDGILLAGRYSNCSYNVVDGNIIVDTQGSHTQRYGVNEENNAPTAYADWNKISDNITQGNVSGGINTVGSNTSSTDNLDCP